MHLLKKVVLLFCVACLLPVHAQDRDVPLFKPSGVYFMRSPTGYRSPANLGDPGHITQGVLRVDLSNSVPLHQRHSQFDLSFFDAPLIHYGMEISVRSKQSAVIQHSLRIGVFMNRHNVRIISDEVSYKHISSTAVDTIRSSETGFTQIAYRDSSHRTRTYSNYENSHAGFDFSWLCRLYPNKTLSLYAGISIMPGILFDARLESSQSTVAELSYRNTMGLSQTNVTAPTVLDYSNTNERASSGVALDFMLPIGINLHPFKKSAFLKYFHLFAEYRPYVGLMHTRDLGGVTRTGDMLFTGIRVHK